jgi:hypothetical protein
VNMMNRDIRGSRRALWVAVFLFLVCFIPSLASWDMMNGGYAWIMLVGFAMVVALITAALLHIRGRQAEDLLSGTGEFIAEWSIPVALWRDILHRQYEEEKTAKRELLRIVWFFCIVIGIGFIIYDPEGGIWVGVVMLFTMFATWLAATLTPGMRLRSLSAAETRVRVGRKCVMLGDELHSWSLVGSWLQAAELEEEEGRHWLRVRYAFLTRAGIQEEQVLLPVPPQELEKAQHAADELKKIKREKPPLNSI